MNRESRIVNRVQGQRSEIRWRRARNARKQEEAFLLPARFNIAARAPLRYAKGVRQILLPIVIGMLLASSALAQQTHSLDVEIGQRVKLRTFGGPNVEVTVNGVDQFDISVTVIDYEHMRFVRTNGNYGYRQPGITNKQVKIADRGPTRLFHRGGCSVYYVPSMDTRMNHAKLEVKVEH